MAVLQLREVVLEAAAVLVDVVEIPNHLTWSWIAMRRVAAATVAAHVWHTTCDICAPELLLAAVKGGMYNDFDPMVS